MSKRVKLKPGTTIVMKPEFKDDSRESNPKLHLLYMKWGVTHLRELQRMGKTLCEFANGNMNGPYFALIEAYRTLCKENAAYAEAHSILRSLNLTKWIKLAKEEIEEG